MLSTSITPWVFHSRLKAYFYRFLILCKLFSLTTGFIDSYCYRIFWAATVFIIIPPPCRGGGIKQCRDPPVRLSVCRSHLGQPSAHRVGQLGAQATRGHYLPTVTLIVIFVIIGIPSPTHSFTLGLNPSFSANPPYRSLSFFSFRFHYMDFPDCLLYFWAYPSFTF